MSHQGKIGKFGKIGKIDKIGKIVKIVKIGNPRSMWNFRSCFDKIKRILMPRFRNSTTHLTLVSICIENIPSSSFPLKIRTPNSVSEKLTS